jgi:hypothetical protein
MKMEVKRASECLYPSANYIAAHPRSSKHQFHKILTSLSPNVCLCSLSGPGTNDAPSTGRQHSCRLRLTCARCIHVRRSAFGTIIDGPRSELHEGTAIVTVWNRGSNSSYSTRPAVPQQCYNCACSTRFITPTAYEPNVTNCIPLS